MLMLTTWKARPISPEQLTRMMGIWGQMEADMADAPGDFERLAWYQRADGTGGLTIGRSSDPGGTAASFFKYFVLLGEFLEFEMTPLLDMEQVMSAFGDAMALLEG
jgi:hypothetical protein